MQLSSLLPSPTPFPLPQRDNHPLPPLSRRSRDAIILTATGASSTSRPYSSPRPPVATVISLCHPTPFTLPKRDNYPAPSPGRRRSLSYTFSPIYRSLPAIHQSPSFFSPSSGRRICPGDPLSLHPPVAQSLAVELPAMDLSNHRSVAPVPSFDGCACLLFALQVVRTFGRRLMVGDWGC